MTFNKFILSACVILSAAIFTCPQIALGGPNDKIIAIVNDDIITQEDLNEFLSLIYLNLRSTNRDPEEIKKIMAYYEANGLMSLIDEKLKAYRADQIELKVRPEAVEKRIGEIRKQYPSESAMTKSLVEQGMTLNDLKKKILDQFKAYYAEQVEVKQKIFVSPQQVNEYYQQNLDQIRMPEGVLVDSIFFPYENKKNVAQDRANQAMTILKDPAQMAKYKKSAEEVAKKFSGTYAPITIRKGESLPEIEKAAFNLTIDEVSDLISIPEGIYIFKMKEKIPESTPTFTSVKDTIYNFLYQKQLEERRQEWLIKLRNDAYIEIR